MGLYPKQILEYLAFEGIPRGPDSHIYCVDPVHGDDDNAGDRWNLPLATVSAALAKCVSGHHDTVLVVASGTAITETAAIEWNKNLTHLVGLGAPTHAAQRTRIVCNATDLSPFFTISGYGCIFRNLYFWQGQDDVHSLVNVSVSGARNYFSGVHFAGGGHATQAIDGGASLLINGGSENRFVDCTIGVDTISAATGMAGLVFAATGGAARNVFERCRFTLYAGNAGVIFVELLGNSGIDRYQLFKDCHFINLSGTAMTQAFAVAGGFDPNNKRVLLVDCTKIGVSKWDNGDTGMIYGNMDAVTGADLSGGLVQMST